jgi:membrane protease YdiL (CAAX protease family)
MADDESSQSERVGTALDVAGIVLLAPTQFVIVAIAILMPSETRDGMLFLLGKIWLIAIPVAWWFLVEKRGFTRLDLNKENLRKGAVLGAALSAPMLVGYLILAKGLDGESVRGALTPFDPTNWWMLLLGAIYWTFGNSWIEEFAYRQFLLVRAEPLLGEKGAVALSALSWVSHHTLTMTFFLPFWANGIASLGLLFAGVMWAKLWLKSRSMAPVWLSHGIADLVIFGLAAHAMLL